MAQPKPIHPAPLGRLRARLRHFDGPGDVREFLAIGAVLTLLPIALSRLNLPQLLPRLDTPSAPRPEALQAQENSAELGRHLALYADYWLGHLRPGNPCLRRSLTLFWRLRRTGLPVTFCLGIRSDQPFEEDEPASGHAWLELDGGAILESAATVAHYATTFRYPPDPRS